MINNLIPFAKSLFIPLGTTIAASARDVAIQMKLHISETITLIISIEEMKDVVKIVKSFEEPDLSIKRVIERTENEAKEKKFDF